MNNKLTKTILMVSVFAVASVFTMSARVLGYGGGGGGMVFGGTGGGSYVMGTVNASVGGSGRVLGDSTCAPTFTKYMRIARSNDRAEVVKLQTFLKTYEGETGLPSTGYFGQMTDAAVKRFQSKYGINPKSGYVYVKTTDKLNEIYCQKVSE